MDDDPPPLSLELDVWIVDEEKVKKRRKNIGNDEGKYKNDDDHLTLAITQKKRKRDEDNKFMYKGSQW